MIFRRRYFNGIRHQATFWTLNEKMSMENVTNKRNYLEWWTGGAEITLAHSNNVITSTIVANDAKQNNNKKLRRLARYFQPLARFVIQRGWKLKWYFFGIREYGIRSSWHDT